jgi:ATP synthase in type III secretion protein N
VTVRRSGFDRERALAAIEGVPLERSTGVVTEVVGLVVRATAPGARVGEMVDVERRGAPALAAEVVGFRGDEAVLLPLGDAAGVEPRCRVVPRGEALSLDCSEALLGRILDGLGRPIDGGPLASAMSSGAPDSAGAAPAERWAVDRPAPGPLERARITAPLVTGIRAIDGFLTLGEGQRVGLFAGSGVGKSTLLGQIARASNADVNVICLVGERGRELREFIEDSLGEAGLARSVVVCATADAPSLVRLKSAHVATAIAEWFRDRGRRVLLLMDSLTRVARAQREVALSAGEPPARQGYPPSVFAALPRLIERAGTAARGSITAVYTVLVAGSDMEEPVADEVRAAVDGHIVLDRALAARGHFPPIDILASLSRVMPQVTSPDHLAAAAAARRRLAIFEDHRDLITLGAYRTGSDRTVDDAIAHQPALDSFLRQPIDDRSPLPTTLASLTRLAR